MSARVWVPDASHESAVEWLSARHKCSRTMVKWLVNRWWPLCMACHEYWPCPTALVLLDVAK